LPLVLCFFALLCQPFSLSLQFKAGRRKQYARTPREFVYFATPALVLRLQSIQPCFQRLALAHGRCKAIRELQL
jgi:hypothetical protein